MDILSATNDAFYLLISFDAKLWKIILLSLGISISALLFATPVALLTAYCLAGKRFIGRQTILVLLQGFLSFPTVVVGLILYMLLSRHGPLGAWGLLFTPQAMAIGQMLIAFPVLTVFALTALQKNGPLVQETAKSLGATPMRTMLTEFHEVRFGLLSALLAGFGRVISEIGCALMVGGNIANHTRTIPTAIALETGKGAFAEGIALGIVLIIFALAASFLLSFIQKNNER